MKHPEPWQYTVSLFLTWNQLRRVVSQRVYDILGRDVHPRPNWDVDFWDFITDDMTMAELAALEKVIVETRAEQRRFYAFYSKWQAGLDKKFVLKLLEPKMPFAVKSTMPSKDGLYFFGENEYFLQY